MSYARWYDFRRLRPCRRDLEHGAGHMRILIANDDGIYSPGLAALAEVASRFGEVRVVAPDVEQSSMGHAITHSRPLAFRRTPLLSKFDRKSTRLNSSHSQISYAVFCLKKK